jgi:TRAP-type C4-dicarboxylate transport system permease small subunit
MKVIGRAVELFEKVFLVTAIFFSVAISVLGVFFRYVLENSLSWVEELAGFLLLTVVTVGIGVAVRQGSHLRVDMLIQFVPRTRNGLNLLANVFALAVMTVLFILSIGFVSDLLIRDQRTTSMYWLPIGVPLIIMPLGYLTAVFRLVESIFPIFRKQKGLNSGSA